MPKNDSRMARRKRKQAKKKPIFKRILLTILMIFLLSGIGVGGVFAYYIATAPELDVDKLSDPFSSKIYNKDGEVIADLGSEQRTKIEFDDLPDILIDAVIATEDVRFFKHSGIDLKRIGGAIKANITRGFGAEGASTITQQVVENAFLTPEKKLKTKVQEQWLALKLEREYSKEQILEMYLNKIFYGSNAYGVAKAAEVYFGKTDLHDLTLIEAAILAGLPQRPTAYNPYVNPDLTKKRVDTVLKLMVRHGKISEEEAKEASQVDISSLLAGKQPNTIPYEAFIQKVRKEVEDKLDANIDTDGLKVYTTLDNDAQEHVEFLLTDSEDNPIPYPDDEMQTGMAVVDTKTGAIRAIGGRRNSEGLGEFNYAFQGGGFQPGSTVKPIIAYGPAIEYNKISTYHQVNDDGPYQVQGAPEIRNWNREYQGWMSARYALTHSLNVPTVKILVETGLDHAQSFAEELGIKFANDQIDLRDAIGGAETNVTPVQLAGAFSAFGNEGIYIEPYAVEKVEFADGQVVDLKPEPKAAMADYTAYMVTDMLKSVVQEGTGTLANIPNLPVAGKTGTTNLEGKSGAPDAWFAGYTTNYTIAIWAGGYVDEEGKRTVMPENGTRIPRHLFKETMEELSKDIETPDFKKPDSVVEVEVEKGSNPPRLPSPYTPRENIVKELFVKGYEPSQTSEKFDQLDPVSQLKAAYDHETNTIDVAWEYSDEEEVEFEVGLSVDGGEMKKLSTTKEKHMTIADVEKGSEYTIQVTVIKDELRSDPVQTKVLIDQEDEEEEIPGVSQLSASYNEGLNIINVSWNYDGPDAEFEVHVTPQEKSTTIQGHSLEISGIEQGQTYTITVTPVRIPSGERGEARSTQVTIPSSTNNEDQTEENENNGEIDDDQEPENEEDDEEENDEENDNE